MVCLCLILFLVRLLKTLHSREESKDSFCLFSRILPLKGDKAMLVCLCQSIYIKTHVCVCVCVCVWCDICRAPAGALQISISLILYVDLRVLHPVATTFLCIECIHSCSQLATCYPLEVSHGEWYYQPLLVPTLCVCVCVCIN